MNYQVQKEWSVGQFADFVGNILTVKATNGAGKVLDIVRIGVSPSTESDVRFYHGNGIFDELEKSAIGMLKSRMNHRLGQ